MSDFQLDKKELLKEVPLMARPIAGALIDWINNLDANHNGKKDLAEMAPIVIKALPVIQALLPLIDWEKALDHLIEKFAHDPEQARRMTANLVQTVFQLVEKVQGSGA